jgi:hypothetical protein
VRDHGNRIVKKMKRGENVFAGLKEDEHDFDESDHVGNWSEEEKRLFLVGLEKYGEGNWSQIATLFPTR